MENWSRPASTQNKTPSCCDCTILICSFKQKSAFDALLFWCTLLYVVVFGPSESVQGLKVVKSCY